MKKSFLRKLLRLFVPLGLGTLVLIQFVPVDRSNPPVESEISVSPEVRAVLRKACYDCHSHETTWPWYSKVAPISWLVASDVHEGRKELNFSAWARYDRGQQDKKLKETWKEIEEGEMPPGSYTLMHRDAVLSPVEQELIHRLVLDLSTKQ